MLRWRGNVRAAYDDVLTPDAVAALNELAPFDVDRRSLMQARLDRRAARRSRHERIGFLPPNDLIARTSLRVQEARDGKFAASEIPPDLQRQWIQGTGPAARPNASLEQSIRNVAYALLSGADGWMFDGEDALGQIATMSLDNQRNLTLAVHDDDRFLKVAEQVAVDMNRWAEGFLKRRTIADWRRQLRFTTRIFRPRGLHLDDRHVANGDGTGFSASIVDAALYVVNNAPRLRELGSSVVLYLPKIQTAEEAALWNDILSALEAHLRLPAATIKTYVLVEQLEACFQLMEIRAVLGARFVGFNTGRWDYINSVSDAMAWDAAFVNPNIDAITMTYGYMRTYEDRVRRAVNTPNANGRFSLWQGGMEPNIPVGTPEGVAPACRAPWLGPSASSAKAPAASGSRTGRWSTSSVPCGKRPATRTSLAAAFRR